MTTASTRLHYGWLILAMGTLVVFGALGLARFGYSMVLPSMQADLRLDNTQAGGLATANLLGYLALSVIGGVLASRFGPRVVVTGGLVLTAAGMFLTGLARSFPDTAAWRALTGIGSGASNVPAMALIAAWFAPRRRGWATGVGASGSSLGLILLGPLVPVVLSVFGEGGWRVCWFIFAGVTLLLALATGILLRNHPFEVGLSPVYAETGSAPAAPKTAGLAWGLVYRSFTVWHIGLVYAAFGFSYIIYMTFFVKHLVTTGGYSSAAAGRLFMVMGGFSLFCGVLWGMISDRIGRRAALVIVCLIHAVAFSLFALWPAPAGLTISAVLYGLTAWSIPAIMAAACGDLLGHRLAPAALGFITLFMGLGQAAGPTVAGAMADRASSLSPAFLLAGVVAFLGAVGAARLQLPHHVHE